MATPNVDYQTVGTAFVDHFYSTYDVDKLGILPLYHEDALLTFSTHLAKGKDAIAEIYANKITFKTVKHHISTKHFQPMVNGCILVCVFGKLQADTDPIKDFTETFVLHPISGNWCIVNHVFNLLIHDI